MKAIILTIFPEIFTGFLDSSLIEKARSRELLQIDVRNIRDFAEPPHHKVDDTPYGGGAGMVMKPEPLVAAIEWAKTELPTAPVILLSPSGERFEQRIAEKLSNSVELILVCGRYEGVDQRVIDLVVDREISIGDYVLMGGEVPAMALLEATVRLIDGVVGNEQSTELESFLVTDEGTMLEAPHYTRPPEFRGRTVPEVLLSGDHQRIEEWRTNKGIERTRSRRPDLLKQPV